MDCLPNKEFIAKALLSKNPTRVDGRGAGDLRNYRMEFGLVNGQATVHLGNTIVQSTISGEVVAPVADRPNEGRLFFNVEVSQIANPETYEYGKPGPDVATITNYVERVLRGSKAVDPESLCVLGGKSVWSIRCDVHTLCDDGSLADACSLAALCGLLNFKHESFEVSGESVEVFSSSARDPVPISVHHLPISTSFAFFTNADGEISWIVDPTSAEEAALCASLSVTVNQHGELCGLHKTGGLPVSSQVLQECINVAVKRSQTTTHSIQELLRNAPRRDVKRKRDK